MMTSEELSSCWRSQKMDTPLSVDDQLLQARKRAARFKRTVLWRDVREVVASILVATVFIYCAIFQPPLAAAGSYFVAVISLGVGCFFLVDRLKERMKHRDTGEEPLAELAIALDAVEHQIWLLERVSWWYLGPLAVGLGVWSITIAFSAPIPVWMPLLLAWLIVGLVFYVIRRLNRSAVTNSLIPERDSVKQLMKQWEEES